jgi:hypothetical protein
MPKGHLPPPAAVVRLERVTPKNRVFQPTWVQWPSVVSDRLRAHLAQLAEVIDLRRRPRRTNSPVLAGGRD